MSIPILVTFIAYFIVLLSIGFYFYRKSVSIEDYLLGGRHMKSWAVGLSLFATLFSAISYMSVPGEMIKYGPMLFCGLFALPLVYWLVGWFLIPVFMDLNITSANELLEKRLGIIGNSHSQFICKCKIDREDNTIDCLFN